MLRRLRPDLRGDHHVDEAHLVRPHQLRRALPPPGGRAAGERSGRSRGLLPGQHHVRQHGLLPRRAHPLLPAGLPAHAAHPMGTGPMCTLLFCGSASVDFELAECSALVPVHQVVEGFSSFPNVTSSHLFP